MRRKKIHHCHKMMLLYFMDCCFPSRRRIPFSAVMKLLTHQALNWFFYPSTSPSIFGDIHVERLQNAAARLRLSNIAKSKQLRIYLGFLYKTKEESQLRAGGRFSYIISLFLSLAAVKINGLSVPDAVTLVLLINCQIINQSSCWYRQLPFFGALGCGQQIVFVHCLA